MSLRRWIASLFVHPPIPDPARKALDTQQKNIAQRLSRLTGHTRDEVLREAYRRADRIVAKKS